MVVILKSAQSQTLKCSRYLENQAFLCCCVAIRQRAAGHVAVINSFTTRCHCQDSNSGGSVMVWAASGSGQLAVTAHSGYAAGQ